MGSATLPYPETGKQSVRWRQGDDRNHAKPGNSSAKLYAIASEIATTEFRMLPSTRFAPSNRVRMSSMKVIWPRAVTGERGTMTYRK